ncbi:MAG: DNA translocase FtsK [Oscillospiraceae bacterium]|nr:DNA translocase FtsK [Oscillospiraceae bacterium]
MQGWVHLDKILKNPHILVAGTPGSGKSTLLDSMIFTIAANDATCAEMILIDPKRVDLYKWCNLPHVLRYETDNDRIVDALDEAIGRMEWRYDHRHPQDYWRHLYVIIDELADLMVTDRKRILPRLQRISQLGRGANVHLVCCTQAPSRKVIPAELTLNFTDRIALRCVSPIESRQIINVSGAENLPRYGTGLYLSAEGLFELDIPKTPDDLIEDRIMYWEAEAMPTPKTFFQKLKGAFSW